MNSNVSFTQKVSSFGFNPPQDHDRTARKEVSNNRRPETQFFNVGGDGSGFKTDHLKNGNETGTFWTVCPYCYHMYEYEKKYEDCCLLCQNCRRGFHGLAVEPPRESFLTKGKGGEYYFGYGLFPLGHSGENGFFSNKKQVVVEISDESGDDKKVGNKDCEVKRDGFGRKRRVKSVARNPKKLWGRGIKGTVEKKNMNNVQVVEMNEEFWKEVDKNAAGSIQDGELDFFQGDDDLFVGLGDFCR
ncbi:hypothetical protein V6N12_017011 [Hibiscus sabdariffa]|uniref:Zinc beta-ribbon domain-containing protein n=1 Tax=Hibiscus sabdariffa TaxID=183260 RepID=A0ABR2AM96_9ROSI